MKVTVGTKELIAAIELRIKKETTAFEQASKEYEQKTTKSYERYAANLEKELARVKKSKTLPDRYNLRDKLFEGVGEANEPKLKIAQHQSVLAKLKLSLDETLTLTDKDDYFDFI